MKLDFDQIRELIRLLDEANLTEIEVEQDDEQIRIRRDPALTAAAGASPAATATGHSGHPHEAVPAEAEKGDYVTSPFVGTFYRAPSPESQPFVELGDSFAPGQVLCIVEAMKLMNEIEAEAAGTVVEIFVEDGAPVEYGDRLFRIEIS